MGSVAGGNTPSSAQIKANNQAAQGYAMQLAKLQSEIDVNKSVAKVNEANAENAGANTKTTNDSREIFIENLRQAGIENWLRNEIEGYKWRDDADKDMIATNETYKVAGLLLNKDSLKSKELRNVINKTAAEIDNLSKQGKAAEENAETNRLALELQKQLTDYQTGKDIDWKNVGELLVRFLPMILGQGIVTGKQIGRAHV